MAHFFYCIPYNSMHIIYCFYFYKMKKIMTTVYISHSSPHLILPTEFGLLFSFSATRGRRILHSIPPKSPYRSSLHRMRHSTSATLSNAPKESSSKFVMVYASASHNWTVIMNDLQSIRLVLLERVPLCNYLLSLCNTRRQD